MSNFMLTPVSNFQGFNTSGGRRMSISTVSTQRYGGGLSMTQTVRKRKRKFRQVKSLKSKIVPHFRQNTTHLIVA